MSATIVTSHLDPKTLTDWLAAEQPCKIIDVRTPAEFESLHIPGSYNVPLDTLGEHREELRAHVQEPVVLVCRSGQRASQAERHLAEVGMANVRVLAGGITGWQAAGAPVRRGRQTWELERQVRLVAGSLVLVSVLGSTVYKPLKFLAGAVGGGLAFAALSNSCLMGTVLARLPFNRAASCNVDEVVAQLTGRESRAA